MQYFNFLTLKNTFIYKEKKMSSVRIIFDNIFFFYRSKPININIIKLHYYVV